MQAIAPEMRRCLVEVLVAHQRVDDSPYVGVCACGWRTLGASWAEHIADVFEESWAVRGAT